MLCVSLFLLLLPLCVITKVHREQWVFVLDVNDLRSTLNTQNILERVIEDSVYGWYSNMSYNYWQQGLSIINFRRGYDDPKSATTENERNSVLQFDEWPMKQDLYFAYRNHVIQQKSFPLLQRALKLAAETLHKVHHQFDNAGIIVIYDNTPPNYNFADCLYAEVRDEARLIDQRMKFNFQW